MSLEKSQKHGKLINKDFLRGSGNPRGFARGMRFPEKWSVPRGPEPLILLVFTIGLQTMRNGNLY